MAKSKLDHFQKVHPRKKRSGTEIAKIHLKRFQKDPSKTFENPVTNKNATCNKLGLESNKQRRKSHLSEEGIELNRGPCCIITLSRHVHGRLVCFEKDTKCLDSKQSIRYNAFGSSGIKKKIEISTI